ncbi:MAG TPA: amidohydrolase [Desulfurivibrio alkaliphilus]|uniref:Amidohydrolase n=1 Tax=Desulfurivibrio alkaliphilus TaxID=427923 RepID=A0A7C2TGU6_9BACT|nr:amidohydrolase [Desulfurivibrio alkaliphilus]
MATETRYLYRAPLVLPVISPPLVDGAVLTADERVLAVGPWAELRGEADESTKVVDYDGHALLPALVNAHCHLELAHLDFLARDYQPEPGEITAWIRRLLAERQECGAIAPEDAMLAFAQLFAGGCRTVIDIGNDPAGAAVGRHFRARLLFHLELLGLSGEREEAALARLAACPAELCCTGHAPYSAGARLLRALKERTLADGCLLPIHVAESAAEEEFLLSGGGPMADFLRERGVDLAAFSPPGCSAVAWLDRLGLLDERTLCVHAVRVSREDVALLADRKAGVCLCPGANRYLGVGKAPLELLLEHDILPALGTDSPAGNPHFSLWREMQTLREDHPAVAPATVLAMASRAGARLAGREKETGVIAPGVESSLLAVPCPAAGCDPEAALEYLTTAGGDVRLEWIE